MISKEDLERLDQELFMEEHKNHPLVVELQAALDDVKENYKVKEGKLVVSEEMLNDFDMYMRKIRWIGEKCDMSEADIEKYKQLYEATNHRGAPIDPFFADCARNTPILEEDTKEWLELWETKFKEMDIDALRQHVKFEK